ncbi:hypothetical protein D3C73_1419110 [compost metagenome]
MYSQKPEPKELLLVEGAVHANAYGINPKRYTDQVQTFIEKALGADEQSTAYLPSI